MAHDHSLCPSKHNRIEVWADSQFLGLLAEGCDNGPLPQVSVKASLRSQNGKGPAQDPIPLPVRVRARWLPGFAVRLGRFLQRTFVDERPRCIVTNCQRPPEEVE